jgi:hypothetical protein
MQHRTVPRSTHLANSVPDQSLVHRTVPVLTSLNNSASSLVVHRTEPISTRITSSRTTEPYMMTDLEDIELTAVAGGVTVDPHLVSETGTTISPKQATIKSTIK